jgi:hypothetical protein
MVAPQIFKARYEKMYGMDILIDLVQVNKITSALKTDVT